MKTKRLLALLMCAVLALALCPAALAEGETEIASAEDLLLLAARPEGSYVLTADIDMTGVDWAPVAFSGTLRGDGHAIYNLRVTAPGDARADSVDGNLKKYDSVYAGLFSTLINARVENLTLRGVDIDIDTAENCFIGAIAGYMEHSEIAGCAVLDARLTLTVRCQPENTPYPTSCNAGIGGIAGFGCGFITDCRAETVQVFVDQCAQPLRCEEFMGGVLSTGNADVIGCAVVIDGYDECRGYAHNGGLVGMFYQYDQAEPVRMVDRCTVSGKITFFEDNADRRAYCQPFIGEPLTYPFGMTSNAHDFITDEVFDYSQKLRPEKCDSPSYTQERLEATCTEWGWTSHTCAVCGYHWNDAFAAPAHVPGEWEITKEPTETEAGHRLRRCTVCGELLSDEDVAPHVPGEWVTVKEPALDQDGLRQLLCADCGMVLREEVIPGPHSVQAVVPSESVLELTWKDSRRLTAEVYPAGAVETILYWSSSDERVVTVDTDGTVHAVGRGSAQVKCATGDGKAEGVCQVHVTLSVKQWLVRIFLFGWVWDR